MAFRIGSDPWRINFDSVRASAVTRLAFLEISAPQDGSLASYVRVRFHVAGDGELVGTMELEQAEAERANLLDGIKTRTTKANKVATLLPRAAERYQAVVNDLACLSKRHVAQAREQIRKLVGEIRLAPTADCYLEAVLTGRMKGVEAGGWGQVK